MNKTNLSQEEYSKLLDFITAELMSKGLKATTMDSIASSYKISKRTLYEIFANKEEMIEVALLHWKKNSADKYAEIFRSSPNVMVAILRSFLFNRDTMEKVSPDFFQEIHSYYQKKHTDTSHKPAHHLSFLLDVLKKGVDEGYFRDDINLTVQCHLLILQMESLRRMEEIFPDGMTLIEVFDAIMITFLRGIATTKGKETLDNILQLK